MTGREKLTETIADVLHRNTGHSRPQVVARVILQTIEMAVPSIARVLGGMHVAVPRKPTREMVERGLDILYNQSHEHNAPEIGDALEHIDLSSVWKAMIEIAERES